MNRNFDATIGLCDLFAFPFAIHYAGHSLVNDETDIGANGKQATFVTLHILCFFIEIGVEH